MVFNFIVYLAVIALVVGMSFVKGKIVSKVVSTLQIYANKNNQIFTALETIQHMVNWSLIGSYLAFVGQTYTLVTNKHTLKYIRRDLLGMSGSGA